MTSKSPYVVITCLVVLFGGAAAVAVLPAAEPAPNPNAMAIDALSRLKGMDLNANPKIKAAVLKVLASTRGTPDFVTLVKDFKLTDQSPGLLEVAIKQPSDEAGVEAMRLLLAANDTTLLASALNGPDSPRVAEALGNTSDKQIVPLLWPLVTDAKRDLALRKQAVRSLVRSREGAEELVKLAQADRLPGDVRFTASTELSQVRWPEVKADAARLLPVPAGQNTQALPPLADLLKMSGDAKKGSQVFARQEVGCINCHQVNGQGVDFGPALSEIGSKLGKDALLESILDPSAGVSFGLEAWSVELKSDEEYFGLIVSETADELAVKDAKAIVTRLKKVDVRKRTQSKLSIMPAGLQQTMSTQDLVDLVEYLSTLRKP
jgi:putative heme-binding domain-containing protein